MLDHRHGMECVEQAEPGRDTDGLSALMRYTMARAAGKKHSWWFLRLHCLCLINRER